jgi:hypothetical protein
MAKWYFGEAARSFELRTQLITAPAGACRTSARYFEVT